MKLFTKYIKVRNCLLSKVSWQKTFAFLRLPELKLAKTCGFILSILLVATVNMSVPTVVVSASPIDSP